MLSMLIQTLHTGYLTQDKLDPWLTNYFPGAGRGGLTSCSREGEISFGRVIAPQKQF
jgi:hypothetical protein